MIRQLTIYCQTYDLIEDLLCFQRVRQQLLITWIAQASISDAFESIVRSLLTNSPLSKQAIPNEGPPFLRDRLASLPNLQFRTLITVFFSIVLFLYLIIFQSQNISFLIELIINFLFQSKMSLVRKPAPDFTAEAWYQYDFQKIKLSDYKGKYVLLFFYPLDFTFVCPTEIIAFSNKAKQFRETDCQVIACSVDSKFSHMEYSLKPRKEGGLGDMDVPLVSDITKSISKSFGCLCETGEEQGVAFRATYIIDRKGIVRHESVNDLPVGRNPDQYLRLVKAFQFVDVHGEVCPAGWNPGDKTMVPDAKKNNYKQVISQAK